MLVNSKQRGSDVMVCMLQVVVYILEEQAKIKGGVNL
jgi:hypothetical protein